MERQFGRAVRDLMRLRGLTDNAVAKAIGINRNTLVSWLDGKPPNVLLLGSLASTLGVSHAYLLQQTDYLPPELMTVGFHLNAAQEARQWLTELARYAESIAAQISHPGALRAASALLDDQSWQVTLRPSVRALRRPILLQTYIGVVPLTPDVALEKARARILSALGPLQEMYSVTWREQEAHDWPDHPLLLLQVPEHERSRPATPSPLPAVGDILFVGTPYGHAETAAACVADYLGYGYADLRYSTQVTHAVGTAALEEATIAAGRQLMDARARRLLVRSMAFPHVLDALRDDLLASPPDVLVHVRSDDALLERGARVWHLRPARMKHARDTLDALVEDIPCPSLVVNVAAPVDDEHAKDHLSDAAQDAADEALKWMASQGMAPPSSQWYPVRSRLSNRPGRG